MDNQEISAEKQEIQSKAGLTPSLALATLRECMESNPDYAWFWQCQVANAIYEANPVEVISQEHANVGAAAFLKNVFKVDIAALAPEKYAAATTPAKVPKMALCIETADCPETFRNVNGLALVNIDPTLWNAPTTLLDRADIEDDPSYQQLLPYIVLVDKADNRVFMYGRGKSGGEAKLVGNLSIGLGGHIDNAVPYYTSLREWCNQEARRELDEEVGLPSDTALDIEYIGLLRDTTNAVGTVHMGILAVQEVDMSEIEGAEADIIDNGKWVTIEELFADEVYDRLENWSKLAVQYLARICSDDNGPVRNLLLTPVEVKTFDCAHDLMYYTNNFDQSTGLPKELPM